MCSLSADYDLIPNIVETVKGYASHEKGTLEAVVAARNQAMTAQGPAAKGEAEGMLTGRCGKCLRWPKHIRNCGPSKVLRNCRTR